MHMDPRRCEHSANLVILAGHVVELLEEAHRLAALIDANVLACRQEARAEYGDTHGCSIGESAGRVPTRAMIYLSEE